MEFGKPYTREFSKTSIDRLWKTHSWIFSHTALETILLHINKRSFIPYDMLCIGETGRHLRTRFGVACAPVHYTQRCSGLEHRLGLVNIGVPTVFPTWKFEPSVPFLVAMIVAKKHEMRLFLKLGTVNPGLYGYGINERFFLCLYSYICPCQTLILTLFLTCFIT